MHGAGGTGYEFVSGGFGSEELRSTGVQLPDPASVELGSVVRVLGQAQPYWKTFAQSRIVRDEGDEEREHVPVWVNVVAVTPTELARAQARVRHWLVALVCSVGVLAVHAAFVTAVPGAPGFLVALTGVLPVSVGVCFYLARERAGKLIVAPASPETGGHE